MKQTTKQSKSKKQSRNNSRNNKRKFFVLTTIALAATVFFYWCSAGTPSLKNIGHLGKMTKGGSPKVYRDITPHLKYPYRISPPRLKKITENCNQLRPYMTKAEVQKLLGVPDWDGETINVNRGGIISGSAFTYLLNQDVIHGSFKEMNSKYIDIAFNKKDQLVLLKNQHLPECKYIDVLPDY